MDELLTTKEAAAYLGVKPQTIRKWRMQGRIVPVIESHGGYGCVHTRAELDEVLTKGIRHATVRKS